jgi:hypothetical protein
MAPTPRTAMKIMNGPVSFLSSMLPPSRQCLHLEGRNDCYMIFPFVVHWTVKTVKDKEDQIHKHLPHFLKNMVI